MSVRPTRCACWRRTGSALAATTSLSWRAVSFDALAAHRKVAMVTDGRCGPREIAAQLMARGKGHRWMVIGENLAMENERIHWLPVSAVEDEYEMNAVVILDER